MIEVLYMLVDNASKYSPAGTAIRVAASVADGHFVKVTVTDEGPGVPPELRERVFEKFFRIPGASRAIRGAWGSGSACRSRAGSSKRRAADLRSRRPRRGRARRSS